VAEFLMGAETGTAVRMLAARVAIAAAPGTRLGHTADEGERRSGKSTGDGAKDVAPVDS
jgi:hypothetical protein